MRSILLILISFSFVSTSFWLMHPSSSLRSTVNFAPNKTYSFEGSPINSQIGTNESVNRKWNASSLSDHSSIMASPPFKAGSKFLINLFSDEEENRMCHDDTLTSVSGTFFDSGGSAGQYANNENCSILIAPPCAQQVTLNFLYTDLEIFYDIIKVYDGSDNSGSLLFSSQGTDYIPELTAQSGQMFITFHTDVSGYNDGWSAQWTSDAPVEIPDAAFTVSNSNPPLGAVLLFTDSSTQNPIEWEWSFGDGSFSNLQNPLHSYSQPGIYQVQLISTNCFGNDTTVQQVYVQGAAEIEFVPQDTLTGVVNCGAESNGSFTIFNTGTGDLEFRTGETSGAAGGPVNMLVLSNNLNAYTTESVLNTLSQNLSDVNFTVSTAVNNQQLTADLQNIDILLVCCSSSGILYYYPAIADALQDFVNEGGKILFCGSAAVSYTNLFEMETENTYGPAILNLNPSHPIMDSIPLEFVGEDNMYVYYWNETENLQPLSTNQLNEDYLSVFTKNIGEGTLVYLGFSYFQPANPSGKILINAIHFLAEQIHPTWIEIPDLAPITIVPPGTSLTVNVNWKASELMDGNYYHTTYFTTNSVEYDTIPYTYHLEVVQIAALATSTDALFLNQVFEGYTVHETLVVMNEGCDTLSVNAATTNPAFETVPQTLTIAPYAQDTLTVIFSEETSGSYTAQLTLESNGGNKDILLTATVLSPPGINVSPLDTLTAVAECGTTINQSLSISNTGASDLEVDLKNLVGGIPKVLILNTNAIEAKVANMLTAINQNYTNYLVAYSETTSSSILATELEGVDILIIPNQDFLYQSFFSSLSGALTQFAEDGGQIIICSNLNLPATGIFSTAYHDVLPSSNLVQNVAPDHPIMEGITDNPFAAQNNTITYNWESDPTIYPLCKPVSNTNYYVVAYKDYGAKSAVYIGFDYAQISDENAAIIGNAMKFLAKKTNPGWIDSISLQSTVIIPPGESLDIMISFNAVNLQVGNYYLNGFITTNDPVSDTLNYTIHFEVSGAAILEVSENEMNFDPILVGLSSADTIYLYNAGCDTLTVSGNNTDPNFTFPPESLSIPPFSQDTLFVFFAPANVGVFSSQLQLTTNGNDEIISLTGEGLAAPLLALNPDTVYVDAIDCADSVAVYFNIHNQGGGDLVYNVAVENWKPELPEVLSNLDANSTQLTSLIPNLFYFQGGDTGTSISGTDVAMYNDGNRLIPNSLYNHRAPYTNSEIHTNTYFGNGSSYFTAKYDGLFVLAADLHALDNFLINGNIGYSSGGTQGFEYHYIDSAGISYTCFATRTLAGSGQANTVNHLVIMRSDTALSHTYSSNYQYENHLISGLTQTHRMYYLLFSTQAGTQVSTADIQVVFETFVNTIIGVKANGTNLSGVINPEGVTSVNVALSTAGLEAGTHSVPVLVLSNDPLHNIDTVLVFINIPDNSCAAFSHYAEMDCSGYQYFKDESTNDPTFWIWEFGDGVTSTAQNPLHAYAQNGVYQVSLEVCNSIDCNTISQTIEVSNAGGLPLICTPATATDQSEFLISEVTLNSTTHESIGSASGYQDFTCKTPFEVTAGEQYNLTTIFDSSTNYHFRAWLDFNNDDLFDESELIYSYSSVFYVANIALPVPIDAVLGEPLRLRIMIDTLSHDPCDSLLVGEVEDHAVVVSAPQQAPEANFYSYPTDPCGGEFSFTDQSLHTPASWLWNFGDGTTSTEQNPDHTYTSSGDYTVQLTATNMVGSDSHSEMVHLDPFGILELTATDNPMINQPVDFYAPGDGVMSWNWDFGDDVTLVSTSPSVSHTYSQPGYYMVTVTSALEYCAYQRILAIEVVDPVGVEDILSTYGIRISPNPSNGNIYVYASPAADVKDVTLFSLQGQKIAVETQLISANRTLLKAADVAAGFYLLQIRLQNGTVVCEKIVIQ